MTSKVFKSVFFAAAVVLLASLVIITAVIYQYFGQLQQSQLKGELHLAAAGTQQMGTEFLYTQNTKNDRLTWIAADGTVLFDSHAEAASMENHAEREEIKEALLYGSGSSTRFSDTLTEETLYEATRLDDGSVLRISTSRSTALVLVPELLRPLALIVILAMVLSAWLAHRIAKAVVEPLNRLDLDSPMENHSYEELSPLLHRIHTQQQEIQSQLQTLQQKQAEFDQITENLQEALVLLDRSERIVSINPAAKVLFGADTDCVGADFLTIDRGQELCHAISEAKTQGHAYFNGKKNGHTYRFDVSRISSAGASLGLVILAFDITDQVNAELHRQEFTANVSHELKTPLQTIIGSAELMENGIVKTEDFPRFVGHIRKEASRLIALIDDIIRLSQLDEEKELPVEEVSLQDLALEVCQALSDAARMKDVSLELSGDCGVVNGVRRLLYEVIYNLCDNAIKYNREGGYVKLTVSEQQHTVQISVEDSGIGIPLEHQDKVFERFYRVDKSHSKQSGGTGLGLSIVKHAVQYHHGKIKMSSEPNKGTTVSIILDASRSD